MLKLSGKHMKIKTRKATKIRNWILLGALLAALFGGSVFADKLFNKSSTSDTVVQEKAAGENIKENSIAPVSEKDDTPRGDGSDPLPEPTPSDDGGKPIVGVDITSVNQDEMSLKLRAIIKTISSSGTCQLSMTHSSGSTYASSANAQALASSTTCKGFDIPLDNLKSGSWKVTLSYENDNVQGQTTKEVSVQ